MTLPDLIFAIIAVVAAPVSAILGFRAGVIYAYRMAKGQAPVIAKGGDPGKVAVRVEQRGDAPDKPKAHPKPQLTPMTA